MTQVSQGDLDKLVPLFDRYQKKLFNFFLRLSADEEASKDLVQNLFVRVIKYRYSYNPEHKFRTWIYQMARNVFYDHCKKNKKTNTFMNIQQVADYPDASQGTQSQQEEDEKLFKALEHLPADKRELLVMSKFQGMKYAEIAEITDTSVGNVKVKVHRAVDSLRKIYFQLV